MDKLIQWPSAKYWDKPWNPMLGCHPCSPACDNCYAKASARRFGLSFDPHPQGRKMPKKGVVFCGNMTDLFGEWRDLHDMGENIVACAKTLKNSNATYLWLTKRPKRMVDALHYVGDRLNKPEVWFGNHYFGITAENQEWYLRRMDELEEAWPKWAKLWISAEPLLAPLFDLQTNMTPHVPVDMIKWLVVGAESGRGRRPCDLKWIEQVVEQCVGWGIPVFVKQICLPNGRFTNKIEEFPEHLRIRQVPWAK